MIRFRELVIADKNNLFEIYSDREAMRFRGSGSMKSLVDAERFVLEKEVKDNDVLTIRKAVELVESGELIGTVMYRFDTRRNDDCEIGYSIGRNYWGQGYGKAIVSKMLQLMIEEGVVTTAIAFSYEENIASVKILEALGFERKETDENEGTAKFVKYL